jgi:hypothetical protein
MQCKLQQTIAQGKGNDFPRCLPWQKDRPDLFSLLFGNQTQIPQFRAHASELGAPFHVLRSKAYQALSPREGEVRTKNLDVLN